MAKRPAEEQGETQEQADGGEKTQQQQAESEPKVKQVTFLDAEDEDKDKNPKKEPRKRKKRMMQQLRTQMEFYFGDANLNKDRFMKERVEKDPEGYVPISVFMTFANINSVTTETEILIKALKFSQFLQLNEDETKVRRTTPVKYMTQEETDARTVYVEGFHKFITREWINTKFSVCGKVAYISLPRFKSTQEIKGYAFVEFEKPEDAENAIKMLNNVPDELAEKAQEKVAASVKQTKNLTYWKKRASKAGIDPAEVEASLKELTQEEGEEEGSKEGTKTRSKKRRKKNRPSVGQTESGAADGATVQKTDSAGPPAATDEPKENTVKQETTSETEDTKVKKSKKSKKKHRRKSNVQKLSAEDGASQNTGDANSSESKSKEGEQSIKTEEVPKDSEEPSTITAKAEAEELKESSSQSSRKRHRSSEADSDQSSAKMARLDSQQDQESKKGGEKDAEKEPTKLKCTSIEGSQKVWELCETTLEGGDHEKDSESQKSSSRKRKRQTSEGNENASQQSGQPDTGSVKEPTQEGVNTNEQKSSSVKRKGEVTEGSPEKTVKVKKQKDSKQGGQSRRSIEQTPEPATGKGRKRKSLEGGEEGSSRKRRKSHAGSSSEAMSETDEQEGKKKRHRKHKQPEPDIRLRVMAKGTWAQLKKEYLEQQKANMRKLKDQLREASRKRREEATNKQNNSQDAKGSHPPADFVPNVILEVKSEAELCLQTIKADIPPSVQVAYVDIRPGMTDGFIRCKDADSASKLLKTGLRGLTLSRMEGEPELQYWNKLVADRQNKLSDTKRRKRRGKLKILQRAQNPQESNPRQHVIFADDDTDKDKTQNPANMRDDFNAYSYYHNAYKYPYLYRTPEKSENRNTPRSMGRVYYPPY